MINNMEYNILDTLTGKLLELYQIVKDVFAKIYSKIRTSHKIDELKENFEQTTARYAWELKNQGYVKEASLYLTTCAKFSCLLDTPNILIEHKKFFTDIFARLDYLICIKTNKPEIYEEEYKDFFDFFIEQSYYFGKEMYVPKHGYDEEALSKIMAPFVGGCK